MAGAKFNPRQALQGAYDKSAADTAAAEAKRVKSLIDDVPVVGKGAMTFADIDKYLTDNPDAEFIRIANGGSVSGARSYQTEYGAWDDNSAAIVGTDADKGARDIFRYANISAADVRTGKRGETPTVGIKYAPADFYSANKLDFTTENGLILSRTEYGDLKNTAKDKGFQNFENPEKSPSLPSDLGKEKSKTLLTGGADETRRAGLGSDEASGLAELEDVNLPKRSLLG